MNLIRWNLGRVCRFAQLAVFQPKGDHFSTGFSHF
jgi:hypothetical protein